MIKFSIAVGAMGSGFKIPFLPPERAAPTRGGARGARARVDWSVSLSDHLFHPEESNWHARAPRTRDKALDPRTQRFSFVYTQPHAQELKFEKKERHPGSPFETPREGPPGSPRPHISLPPQGPPHPMVWASLHLAWPQPLDGKHKLKLACPGQGESQLPSLSQPELRFEVFPAAPAPRGLR